MTARASAGGSRRRRRSRRGCTLTIFAVAGGLIFKAFGISLGAFKIAGGIMLLLMAIDMMRAQPSPTRTTAEEQDESLERGDDIAIFPLAVPMLAGPGRDRDRDGADVARGVEPGRARRRCSSP